jgi:hypothetical protein
MISLKTQTPLTREEVCYALETLFAWQGFKLVPEGDRLAKLVPISGPSSGK